MNMKKNRTLTKNEVREHLVNAGIPLMVDSNVLHVPENLTEKDLPSYLKKIKKDTITTFGEGVLGKARSFTK